MYRYVRYAFQNVWIDLDIKLVAVVRVGPVKVLGRPDSLEINLTIPFVSFIRLSSRNLCLCLHSHHVRKLNQSKKVAIKITS